MSVRIREKSRGAVSCKHYRLKTYRTHGYRFLERLTLECEDCGAQVTVPMRRFNALLISGMLPHDAVEKLAREDTH